MFVDTPQIQSLCSVACCYMKLTADENEVNRLIDGGEKVLCRGFPLSEKLKTLIPASSSEGRPPPLSYEARELACHALEQYVTNRLALEEERDKLKIHGYRALLEKLIVAKFPDKRRLGLRGVKNAHLMEFPE
jgi:hypothetical protein